MSNNLEWADHVGKGATKASRQIARLTKERDDLRKALRYARRFLNPQDHDTAYVDEILNRHNTADDKEPFSS